MHTGLKTVIDSLEQACRRTGRNSQDITLVAVSKTVDSDAIIPVLESGHRVFGENRIQECRDKWLPLKQQYPDVVLHLIGSVQTNKVKYLPHVIDVIETLDRTAIAIEIKKQMDKNPTWKPKLFIQVNTGGEPQKAGVMVAQADAFIQHCINDIGVTISGLMCIPPVDDHPALHFALLRKIALRNTLPELSMGMSDSFETAVEFNTTNIRVGTALFGNR